MSIEIKGSDYTRTTDNTTLGVVILNYKIYSKLPGVLHKYKRQIDDKKSRVIGVSYGVDGDGIYCGGFDV